jgi:hypothetical protein
VKNPEAVTGLAPWSLAELPLAPTPKGFGWMNVVGPGVIVLGLSIGSGEFLLGPATFVRHGFSLLWVTTVAVFLQTVFNMELMRYTVATGEPIFTGFMRTRPSSTFWAWVYTVFYFLQSGWGGWAATAAGAMFFLKAGRIATPEDRSTVYLIGVAAYLACVVILLFGRRIERTLEILNWIMVLVVLVGFAILATMFAPTATWIAAIAGVVGYDTTSSSFQFLPSGTDFVLLAGLVGYSGAGGCANLSLSNWARDKGYGMGERAGYIPAVVGGKKINLAHSGFIFDTDADGMKKWKGWWRIVRADQWGVFYIGASLGMILPAILYVTFIERGSDIRGLGIAAQLAANAGAQAGPVIATSIALLAAWLLFKTQLDSMEGMVRSITDVLWSGSRRIRDWRGGDVRAVYYSVLGIVVIWGMIALRLAQPIMLIQIGANMAAFIFIVSSLHVLYINTRLLPVALRPPMWRRACLVGMSLFYAFFCVMSVRALL